MRFYLSLTLPLLLFLTPLHSLDSETNSPTYKFTIVSGAPTTLNASDVLEVASFEECTEKCQKDQQCIMAYQANSSDPCYLFAWNSIQEVARNESGGVGTVAFKVYTDQPSCELNAQFLMNGRIYPISPNDTMNYLWKIDTSEDGWKITYIEKREEENLVCGNFSFNRPYPDGCNPECMTTMVQLNGEPGPLSYTYKSYQATTWMECVNECQKNRECFVTYFRDGVENCTWYMVDDIMFINRTEASAGKHIALKLPLSNRSCKLTTDELLNDQYYVINEEPQITRTIPGCEMNTVGSQVRENGKNDPNPIVCMRLENAPGITYNAAKEICNEWDGKLMTQRHAGFLQICYARLDYAAMPWRWITRFGKWGFPDWPTKDVKFWMGLEKDNGTGQWHWLAPEWAITNNYKITTCKNPENTEDITFYPNKVEMTWAPGQPVNKPGLDCAYTLHKAGASFPGFGHYSSTCDAEQADGFLCGTPRQQDKGIMKYADIMKEYEG
ncbi:hypothetical protein CAEBREN_25207 [Caenorhabditis brenneri]|uniref:PAN-3 domain-containing protein n=1 Tax=Caenorhabditis brenneri TaxID=135651 RepID=G0P6I2_CAEBE|nr:hypothetical protein CAEBREN_25207 [Caenorhabditis brenneri]